ncbi:transposase [Planococcus halotolerans]|uniref:Transposase n=1 Tax=Planococcus halotolerans TaxID=2233542 RepID=A0A365L5N1_9BACL|nr:transposase [Planococcus halotolerans]
MVKVARKRRVWNPSLFEHATTRGNNRKTIFHEPSDYRAFFRVLDYTYEQYPFTIISYCIMTNHYHLLIRSPEVPLGKVMGLINKRYGDYYRAKYGVTGYLYEGRYYAEKVDGPAGILAVSRYIHRNPIAASKPLADKMATYPYSSYYYYVSGVKPAYRYLELNHILPLLTHPYDPTPESYSKYCEETLSE